MKIYFATWLTDRSHGDNLTKTGANTRLLSYHFIGIQGITNTHFKDYVKTGVCDTRKIKK